MDHLIVFALVLLILSIGITTVLPFSYSEELVCPSGEVEVVRITNPNSICIDQGTAHRWTQLGIAEIVGDSSPTIKGVDEKSITPVVSGGTLSITETPIIGTPDKEYPKNYVPGTEELAEDEIRLTFLGTGIQFP